MNCAQVKEQLLDFLYGELEAAARTAFLEHLRGCPGCHGEVSGHERALSQARTALTGPLLQQPPTRVHLAVMEAARTQAKSAKPKPHEALGLFARLWRTPWLLPAFGAASVATVVFLVRVLKDPEIVPGQRSAPLAEDLPGAAQPHEASQAAAEPLPAPALAVEPKASAAPAEARTTAGKRSAVGRAGAAPAAPKPARGDVRADALGKPEAQSSPGAGRFAEPPPRRDSKARKDVDAVVGSFKDDRFAAPAAEPAPHPAPKSARASRYEDSGYGRPPARVGAPEPAPRPSAPPLALRDSPLPPPPPVPARNEPAAPVHAPATSPAAEAAEGMLGPKPASPADKKKAEVERQAPLEAADAEEDPAEGRSAPAKGASSLDESVKKADRLFAARQWGAAATVYRELVSRYPAHRDAPKWRERMSQSLVAEEQAIQTKAKRAGSAASKAGPASGQPEGGRKE